MLGNKEVVTCRVEVIRGERFFAICHLFFERPVFPFSRFWKVLLREKFPDKIEQDSLGPQETFLFLPD